MIMCGQKLSGKWTRYPISRGTSVTALADTPGKLYYISAGTLYSYDKDSGTVRSIMASDGLSGQSVSQIRYNAEKSCLVVVSDGGGLDLIDDKGTITPLPDIKNIRTPNSREIKLVDFAGDKMVVSADFGVVIYDLDTRSVSDFGIYDADYRNPSQPSGGPGAMCVAGSRIYGQFNGDTLRQAGINSSIRDVAAFSNVGEFGFTGQMFGVDDHHFYFDFNNSGEYQLLFIVNVADNYGSYDYSQILESQTAVWRGGDKMYVVGKDGGVSYLYDITDPANLVKVGRIPAAVADFKAITASSWSPLVWFATSSGICAYDLGASTTTPAVDFISSGADGSATSVANICIFEQSLDGKRIYATTRGSSEGSLKNAGTYYNPDIFNSSVTVDNATKKFSFYTPSFISMIEDDRITDVTPRNLPGAISDNSYYYYTSQVQGVMGNMAIGLDGMAENPANPGEFWIATLAEGLYKVTPDGKTYNFSYERGNMANNGGWGEFIHDVKFDSEGNLWILSPTRYWGYLAKFGDAPREMLQMLPADKVNGDYASITRDDWVMCNGSLMDPPKATSNLDGEPTIDGHLIISKASDGKEYLVMRPRFYVSGFHVYKRNSTGADVSADETALIETLVSQDGVEYLPGLIYCISADLEGRVWMATPNFIGTIDLPSFDPSKSTLPVKIAYEGMSTTPILLGEEIIDIAQAPDGTMWIATQTSGLYHLDRDANTILDHFNADNSPLPSDILGAVEVNRNTGAVYVGSRYGLMRYDPDKAPAADDLENVTVSPSPVPAGYAGWFTISNLTDGCQIAVTDSQGNRLFEGQAIGGTVTWNGLDSNGDRIANGVYYVTTPSATAPVAKIVIVD